MKRLASAVLLICLLAVGIFTVPVSADSEASKAELYCTINQDGDCLVRMTVTFHMEDAKKDLTFPLPAKASNITMNGSSVSTSSGRNAVNVNVGASTGGMVGDFTVFFDYTIPKVVKVNSERNLDLELPLLCGFDYKVSNMTFVITMPDMITSIPSFNSTYMQTGFASNLELTVKDNMITGATKNTLNDHEFVTMSMTNLKEMFPTISTYKRTGNPELIPMGICAGLALLYWLLFLRTLPPARLRSTMPPAGVSAGELNCRLTMSGGDLTMLVLTWAQAGYLLIHLDGNGRVLLHKQMDMGNERSLFEVRVFQSLFGNRRVVDCTGAHYAAMCNRTAAMIPGEKSMCKPKSGNRRIVRILLCLGMVFCGICVAMNMTGIVILEVLFSVLFGLLGIITAWQMQNMAFAIYDRRKTKLWMGLVCVPIWVVLGIICHQPWIPLGACAAQMLFGLLIAFGGMRTDLNRMEAGEILGLRRFLRKIPQPEAARLQKADPEYFFRMAPFAIAMGVGKPFAAAFGKKKLDQCPYFVTRVHGKRTAEDWMRLMVQAVSVMDAGARRMELEKWMAIRFTK